MPIGFLTVNLLLACIYEHSDHLLIPVDTLVNIVFCIRQYNDVGELTGIISVLGSIMKSNVY